MRDITLEDTFQHQFSTRAFATGIPGALTGGVLSVKESGNATPITAGVSVTLETPIAGMHEAAIVATAANGYEAGKSYSIYISTGTVGGVSVVGEIVGQFTIGASAAAIDLANGTDGLGAIKAETALIVADTGTTLQAELDAIQAAVITNAAGVDIAADIIAMKAETVLIIADTNELQADDTPTAIAAVQTVVDKIPLSDGTNTWNATALASIESEVNDALVVQKLDHLVAVAESDDPVDNSIIAKLANSGATADWSLYVNTTDSLMAIRDHIADGTNLTEAGGDGDHLTAINLPNQTMDIVGNITGNLSGSVGSVTGNVDGNVTGSVASNLELGPAEVNTQADLALTDIHLDHLMAVAAADVIVDGSVIAHMVSTTEDWSTFIPSTDSLQSIRDKQTDIEADTNELQSDDYPTLIAAVQSDTDDIQTRLPAALVGGLMSSDVTAISTSSTAADNLEESALGIVIGAAVGTPTTTVIDTDLTEATTDHYKGRILTFVDGSVAGQSTDITGYNGSTKELTVTALTNAPSAVDKFVIT